MLKKSRWCLLKRRENLTDTQRLRLRDLLHYNLQSVRAYLLKEELQQLWEYDSPTWAGKFLDQWCTQASRARDELLSSYATFFGRQERFPANREALHAHRSDL